MDLRDLLQQGDPFIWVATAEFPLVYDALISYQNSKEQKRKIYRMHPLNGLQSYSYDTGNWRVVLIQNAEEEWVKCGNFEYSVEYVYKNRGIFVIQNAHLVAENILPIVDMLIEEYRTSWFSNSADELPMQLICISNDMCPSAELGGIITQTTVGVPSLEALTSIVNLFVANSKSDKILPDGVKPEKIAVAGLGLTESHFRSLVTKSFTDRDYLDHDWILEEKMAALKQSCGLDIRKPKISFEDIGGLDNIKRTIKLATWIWNNPTEAAEQEVEPMTKFLMVGIPGTGKSAICEALAVELGLDLAKIGVSQALSKWIGESESNTRNQFKALNALKPIVAWIDEFGRDFSGGGTSNDSGTTDRVHGEFLTGIQELDDKVFLMAAANNIEGLAPELLRAGRFDKIFFVGFPAYEERISIFKIHLGKNADNYDLEELAAATPCWTGAEIQALIAETKTLTFGTEKRLPTTEELLKVAKKYKNRLWLKRRGYVVEMYKQAFDQFEWASRQQRKDAEAIIANREPTTSVSLTN